MNIMELKFHNHINDVKSMMKRIKNKINQKNQTNNKSYCKQIVNDIIYNEKAHIVAIFKDYLIYDDTSEFLKRIYKLHETKCRLLKIFEFYDSYSKIFPNYTILPEAKYIYKNIQRKQKMIDNLQKKNNNKMLKIEKNNEDKIFVTDIYNSIMNLTVTSQKNEEINQNHQINFFQDKITKLDLNLSIKIDNSVQSFEGLIESIAKAEEKSVKPIKYIDNLKKVDPAREYKLNINTLLLNNANNTNLNKFNKKIDLTKQTLKTKTDLSPNMKINIPKETIISNKNYSHRDNTLFKSIQFNDKININNILENSSHMNLYKNKESFNTKASINEDKKTPQTDRINKNEISHKVTLSMPKLAANNHIYNNFNIINNFHAADPNANNNIVIPYSHINFVSELSPTTNSARVVHKIEIKKEEKIIKKEQILKNIKTNTSHSTNHNNNINKSNTDNNSNSNLIKLRKNHTKTNILRETVRVNSSNNFINNSTLKINLLKISSSLSQSNIPQKSQNSNILLMNTIKSPSNNEKSNSINLTKRDRAISLTARQVNLFFNLVYSARFEKRNDLKKN